MIALIGYWLLLTVGGFFAALGYFLWEERRRERREALLYGRSKVQVCRLYGASREAARKVSR